MQASSRLPPGASKPVCRMALLALLAPDRRSAPFSSSSTRAPITATSNAGSDIEAPVRQRAQRMKAALAQQDQHDDRAFAQVQARRLDAEHAQPRRQQADSDGAADHAADPAPAPEQPAAAAAASSNGIEPQADAADTRIDHRPPGDDDHRSEKDIHRGQQEYAELLPPHRHARQFGARRVRADGKGLQAKAGLPG